MITQNDPSDFIPTANQYENLNQSSTNANLWDFSDLRLTQSATNHCLCIQALNLSIPQNSQCALLFSSTKIINKLKTQH